MKFSMNFSLLGGRQLIAFAQAFISLVVAQLSVFPQLMPFLTNVQEKFTRFVDAWEREQSNPVIESQSKADKDRANAFMVLRDTLVNCSRRKVPGMREAALVLIDVLKRHEWSISNVGKKARTGIIDTLLNELKTNYTNEIAVCQLQVYINELDADQSAYKQASENVIKYAADHHLPTVADTRPELIEAIRALLQSISLLEISGPSDLQHKFHDLIDELVIKTMASVKGASTRSENKKKKGNDDNSTK